MKLLDTLALLTIGYVVATQVERVHAHRTHGRPAAKPVEVERWEDEGGGLPTGGPGPGVTVDTTQPDPDLVRGGLS
ncbi:MAG TPA: hypothetical protein VH328_14705 [Burkholderiaceae bacterium]|jgi:hypothetical protein|nr:hypothetical protein [Burkholderiaceae bacterium]